MSRDKKIVILAPVTDCMGCILALPCSHTAVSQRYRMSFERAIINSVDLHLLTSTISER
jgi:hypothetical protein